MDSQALTTTASGHSKVAISWAGVGIVERVSLAPQIKANDGEKEGFDLKDSDTW